MEHEAGSLKDHLRVIGRRKWVVLLSVLLAIGAAVFFSLRQERLYEGMAEVLLSRQNLAAELAGVRDALAEQQPDRLVQTQAVVAETPAVAQRVLKAVGSDGGDVRSFLERSSVSPRQNADLLQFRVRDARPARARLLATEYARQFTRYRLELDTISPRQARREVGARLARLEREGEADSELYARLVEKEQQLRTIEALQTSNAFLVRPADETRQVQPQLIKNGVVAAILGLLLGIGLAFLWQALDTKARSGDEIGEELELQPLGRLRRPPRRLEKRREIAMLAEPVGVGAEEIRMLRASVEFANLDLRARTIMFTSAAEEEGKSTTVANLAVAFARAGKSVALVDLDLRRPRLHEFFKLPAEPGISELARGYASLDRAMRPIPLGPHGRGGVNGNGNGRAAEAGRLIFLPAGVAPPDVGDFTGGRAAGEILAAVRERADLVLVDAPPLLQVGDAMALSASVDALLVVARLGSVRRPRLRELRRVLDASPARKLGFVLTDSAADRDNDYHYHYRHVRREPLFDAVARST